MSETKKENEWLDKATAAAIDGARKVALSSGSLMNAPVGRLNNHEWGMLVTGAIFGWVETRVQQAIDDGVNQEAAVRMTGLNPDPCDVAVIRSILPELADTAGVDWALPLQAWSKDVMSSFLLLAWKLISAAEAARDHSPGTILKPAAQDWKANGGDPLPPFGL